MKSAFDFADKVKDRGIGKTLYVLVESDNYGSKSVKDDLTLWSFKEKEKLASYLEDNHLKIKKGKYIINQATTFEEALEIFKFDKIVP
ncbi:MAG: hypothetical protein ACYC21_15410, partial [Eubacteriales bacterium]